MTAPVILDRFIVTNYTITCVDQGIEFYCETDNDVRLKLQLCVGPPQFETWAHKKRGTVQFHDRYYVPNVYRKIWQQEEGDTTGHTFLIDDIAYDVEYYWFMHAWRQGVELFSISQIFHHHCEDPGYPAYSEYEKSIPYTAVGGMMEISWDGVCPEGYGWSTEWYALSQHPINRLTFQARMYSAAYDPVGLDVRLYLADADGRITGGILRQATVHASEITSPVTPDTIQLPIPQITVFENWHYCWVFMNLEIGIPQRRTLVLRGNGPNYTTGWDSYCYKKEDMSEYQHAYPQIGYFVNEYVKKEE